jgi:hypothetical protein
MKKIGAIIALSYTYYVIMLSYRNSLTSLKGHDHNDIQ